MSFIHVVKSDLSGVSSQTFVITEKEKEKENAATNIQKKIEQIPTKE